MQFEPQEMFKAGNAVPIDGSVKRTDPVIFTTMPDSELKTPVTAYHLCELSPAKKQFDIVFLAAKSHDTRWLCEFIKPYLKEDGVIVGTQNGMNNADIIAFGWFAATNAATSRLKSSSARKRPATRLCITNLNPRKNSRWRRKG